MPYTLGQAAKATGKSKPTLARAIQTGKISASRQDDGSYRIDPAELHRVFAPVALASNETGDTKQGETGNDTGHLQATVNLLRELIEQLESERDDLRRRLDDEADERRAGAAEIRRLTLLLTHDRGEAQAPPQIDHQPAPLLLPDHTQQAETERFLSLSVRPFLFWLALGAATAAAAAKFWDYGR